MQYLTDGENVLSIHITREGANEAAYKYRKNDTTGKSVSVYDIPLQTTMHVMGTIACCIAIGVMLAWRG